MQQELAGARVRAAGLWRLAAGAMPLACGAYLALSLYQTLQPGGAGQALAALRVALPVGLSLLCIRIGFGARELDPATRRFWALLGAGLLLELIGQKLWIHLPAALAGGASAVQLCGFAGILWAILALPSPLRHAEQRVPFWLDLLTVALGASMWAWHLVLAPAAFTAGEGTLLEALTALAAPVGDIVLLFALLVVLLQEHARGVRRALQCLTAWCVLRLGADLTHGYRQPGYTHDAAELLFRLFADSSHLLLALAVLCQLRPGAGEMMPRPRTLWWTTYRRMPYVALAIGYGLLLFAARDHWASRLGLLVWAAGLLTAATLARQVWMLLENARLQRETAEQRGEARFRSLVQRSLDVILVLDAQRRILFASPAVERLLGCTPAAAAGQPLSSLTHPEDAEKVERLVSRALSRADDAASGTFRVHHPSGDWRTVEAIATNLIQDASVGGIVLNLRDVTERVTLEAQLAHQALHDPLTGLANRVLFRDRLEHALTQASRRLSGVAVMFLDLDDFKIVNDTLGHAQGDQLLARTAQRLLSATRESDTVARLGGDEFAILLTDVTSDEQIRMVADRVLKALQDPIPLEGKEVHIAASIGTVRSRPGDQAEDMLKNADLAMYQAKRQGKGRHAFYEDRMLAQVLARMAIEQDLRAAVEHPDRHFELHYQPILDLVSGTVTSVEVLLRWRHPDRGLVMPADFIPVAEETGLIVPLGRWVLARACAEAASWKGGSVDPDGAERPIGSVHISDPAALDVTVNVSGREVQERGFVEAVLATLRQTGLPPRRLTLEITESVLMHDTDTVHTVLRRLREVGVRWAVDDFGTGYSSLSYLRRFPVDVLKLDRSFVSNLSDGPAAALVNTVVMLGQALSLSTVAEGIETADQLRQLQSLGCELGQGYLFSRPIPREKLLELFAEDALRAGLDAEPPLHPEVPFRGA